MSTVHPNGQALRPLYATLRFKDFDVTWAGPNPLRPGFCFGSEDGRLLFTDEEGSVLLGPGKGSVAGEAVNGVAWSGEWLATSTRADITMCNLKLIVSGLQHPAVRFPHGAHGIFALPRDYFVAPLGRTGIVLLKAGSGPDDPVVFINTGLEEQYFYRVTALRGQDGQDLLVCAGRQGGLGVTDVSSGLQTYTMRVTTFNGLDVVDVCAIAVDPTWPAAAALGRDGTLILVRDVVNDQTPVRVTFQAVQGTAYRILSARGHLLVLTSRGLYVLKTLGERLVQGTTEGRFCIPIRFLPLQAADMNLVGDRWLLVVMPDEVWKFDLEQLEQQEAGAFDEVIAGILVQSLTPAWEVHRKNITSVEKVDHNLLQVVG